MSRRRGRGYYRKKAGRHGGRPLPVGAALRGGPPARRSYTGSVRPSSPAPVSAMPTDDPFAPLREALSVSPTNVPLRLHLADGLLAAGRADEAEAVCKDGLTRTPNEPRLKLALARAYLRQG